MKKRNQRHVKRVKNLVIVCTLCAIILAVSTYAWFIGMKTVNVSSFDVKIAAIDGLSLSIDGESWGPTINITQENFATDAYEGNTNNWGGEGLIPISTVGKINPDVSRLIMYEKGSLATTPGGYRLMASEVRNTGAKEQNGYVVFDLFIKNLSGTEYYPNMNQLNEEDIYLTIDSQVNVSSAGTAEEQGIPNTGIENSVRVAFAQIGRVKATVTDASTITGITCATAGDVTGICADRDAQIWEPNDRDHVQNAISWYKTSCLKRIGDSVTDPASYSGQCNNVEDNTTYKTYAVSGVIDYTDKVDVYDGEEYNGYKGTTATTATLGKLMAYPYFTDTMKNYAGTSRPTFITLAPNSITKVRIYVYIEGQDVDNYDFASLGRKISVQFGFTKERFFDEDINYDNTGTAELPDDVIKELHATTEEQGA